MELDGISNRLEKNVRVSSSWMFFYSGEITRQKSETGLELLDLIGAEFSCRLGW